MNLLRTAVRLSGLRLHFLCTHIVSIKNRAFDMQMNLPISCITSWGRHLFILSTRMSFIVLTHCVILTTFYLELGELYHLNPTRPVQIIPIVSCFNQEIQFAKFLRANFVSDKDSISVPSECGSSTSFSRSIEEGYPFWYESQGY